MATGGIYLDNNTFFRGASAPTDRLPRGWTREDVARAGKCDRCGTHIEAGTVAPMFCSAAESWLACSAECACRLTPKAARMVARR